MKRKCKFVILCTSFTLQKIITKNGFQNPQNQVCKYFLCAYIYKVIFCCNKSAVVLVLVSNKKSVILVMVLYGIPLPLLVIPTWFYVSVCIF